ncbi:MAG: hypothetical protein ABI851_12040 [Saprospiraceae bacterium]
MPVQVILTAIPPINVIGTYATAVQVGISIRQPIELVLKTNNISASSLEVKNEIPMGLVDGSNPTFTSYNLFIPETIQVYMNGVRNKIGYDFITIGNDTILFSTSPINGDIILIDYQKL